MKLTAKTVLIGYGVFAVVNAAVWHWTRNVPPGAQKLVDFNNSLTRVNLLAYLFPASAAAAPAAATSFAPLPAPVVTQQESGTTTYYGS